MSCKTKLLIQLKQPYKDDKGQNVYSVPINCGKCQHCKKQKITEWSFRITKEADVSDNVYFATITYNSDNIPYCKIDTEAKIRTKEGLQNKYSQEDIADNITKVPTLNKSDVQKLMKRLRIIEKSKYGKKYKINEKGEEVAIKDVFLRQRNKEVFHYLPLKYYAVGEYGEKNRRPHMHILFMNIYDQESIEEAWRKENISMGDIQIKDRHANSVLYTLKYLEKETKHYNWIKHHKLQHEYSLSSKRLGDKYVTPDIIAYHRSSYDNNTITLNNGTKGKLPRYLFDKIYGTMSGYNHMDIQGNGTKDEDNKYRKGMYKHYSKQAEKDEEKAIKMVGIQNYFSLKGKKREESLKFKSKNNRD